MTTTESTTTCAACLEPIPPTNPQISDVRFGDEVFCTDECVDIYEAATDPDIIDSDLDGRGQISEPVTLVDNAAEIIDAAEASAPPPAVYVEEPPAPLGQFPVADEWRGLCQMANIMAYSNLVPDALRRRPEDVLLVLLTGRSLGIDPTTALAQCYVVDGKVTIAPKLRLALLHQSGKGRVVPHEVGQTFVVGKVLTPSGEVIETRTLNMDEVPPSLTRKKNWSDYPSRMLWWRLAGWLLDDHFPEIGLGIYSPDELGAITDDEGVPISPTNVAMPDGYGGQQSEPEVDPLEVERRKLASAVVAFTTESPAHADALRAQWASLGLPKTKDMESGEEIEMGLEAVELARAAVEAAAVHDERPFTVGADSARIAAATDHADADYDEPGLGNY
jgi:hypothetical protein